MAIVRIDPVDPAVLGTGVMVGPRHMATALHVVGSSDTNLFVVLPTVSSISDYQSTEEREVQTVAAKIVAADPFRDLCILELDGVDFNIRYEISGADDAPTGLPVHTIGFPHASTQYLILTSQPTTVGARMAQATNGVKSKYLILNMQTRPGQSGSPVFTDGKKKLVGIIVGSYAKKAPVVMRIGDVDPRTLHQTTHAISAEYILGMIP